MNSFMPPTITQVEDDPNIQTTQTVQANQIMESIPTITPVEDEVQYVQPHVQYEEEPQIQYVEQPQIEYVEQPTVQYVEEQPQIQYVPPPQPVVIPVATPPPAPVVQEDDLTKYYAILDGFGPLEPDDDFQLEEN